MEDPFHLGHSELVCVMEGVFGDDPQYDKHLMHLFLSRQGDIPQDSVKRLFGMLQNLLAPSYLKDNDHIKQFMDELSYQ